MANTSNSLNASDVLQITNLIHLFFHHLDSGKGDEFAKLFTEDGTLSVPFRKLNSAGSEQLKQWCENVHAKFLTTTHWEGNIVIQPADKDKATNVSYWKAINEGKIVSLGKHIDEFVNVNGQWKFLNRKVEFLWTQDSGNVKEN